jgi:hypothetical protein
MPDRTIDVHSGNTVQTRRRTPATGRRLTVRLAAAARCARGSLMCEREPPWRASGRCVGTLIARCGTPWCGGSSRLDGSPVARATASRGASLIVGNPGVRERVAEAVCAPGNVRGLGAGGGDCGAGRRIGGFDAGRAAQNMILVAWNEGDRLVPERDAGSRWRRAGAWARGG